MKTNLRNIPSLDGLRAISVSLVILAHVNGELAQRAPIVPYWVYVFWGTVGVQMFFIISGFLITHLLMKELNATGRISLKHFYFRRAFRIFPPFYAYLAVAFIATVLGVFPGELKSFVIAASYTWNYLGRGSELLLHTWSLSLEEQFYLLWPLALIKLGTERSLRLAVWVILLSPFSRIATYFLWPSHRAGLIGMLHTGLDSIMFGCLLALVWRSDRFNQFIRPFIRGWVAALAAIFVLIINPIVGQYLRGSYDFTVGLSLGALCLFLILIYAIRAPASPFGWLLNTRVLRHLGVISYGIYLWQEMMTRFHHIFPWSVPATLACAEISYWVIERPSFRLRDRLERTLKNKPAGGRNSEVGASLGQAE